MNFLVGVLVNVFTDLIFNLDGQADLLEDFTFQSGDEVFTRFDLASRELPVPRATHAWPATKNQYFSGAIQDRCNNMNRSLWILRQIPSPFLSTRPKYLSALSGECKDLVPLESVFVTIIKAMFSSPDNLSHFSRRNAAIWLSLAFQAGVINAGGVLACHRFVTHTTGFGTTFGTELAYGRLWTGIGMLSVPLFFIVGTMISAFLIDRRTIQNQAPRYAVVLFLMTVLMGITTFAGLAGRLGSFGEPLILARDYTLLAILCLTSGLQNAMVTTAFGAIVRTTHLTGITTDLGIGLVRLMANVQKPESRFNEVRAVWMRMGIITSFILGSTLSSFIYLSVHYWGFAIPFLISGILWIISLGFFKKTNLSMLKDKLVS